MIPLPALSVIGEFLYRWRQAIAVLVMIGALYVVWTNHNDAVFEDGKSAAKQEQKETDDEAEARRKAVPAATSDSVSRSLRAGTF